jgi:hypothetical protein
MTEELKTQRQLLDIIAAMVYQTRLNVECLEGKIKKLKPSNLKDIVLLYCENERNWEAKFMRACKRFGLDEYMRKDLSSEELAYYNICCEFLRQSKDLESLSDVLEIAKEATDLSPVLTNLTAIINNHISKESNE